MGQEFVYRVTSIGRPLDPSYATNKAVLVLMPLAALIAGAAEGLGGAASLQIGLAGLTGALAVFGAWALGRELAPDHNAAAFASMAVAFIVFLGLDSPGLIWLFTTLLLVRIVNRSVGLPARLTDSISALLLIGWVLYSTGNVLIGLVGALAFFFDAVLRQGRRHQFVFAALSLVAVGAWALQKGFDLSTRAPLDTPLKWVVAGLSVGFAVAIWMTRQVSSVGDATGVPLSLSRVRAGMLIGLLMALAALNLGSNSVEAGSLLWAVLSGVLLEGLWRSATQL